VKSIKLLDYYLPIYWIKFWILGLYRISSRISPKIVCPVSSWSKLRTSGIRQLEPSIYGKIFIKTCYPAGYPVSSLFKSRTSGLLSSIRPYRIPGRISESSFLITGYPGIWYSVSKSVSGTTLLNTITACRTQQNQVLKNNKKLFESKSRKVICSYFEISHKLTVLHIYILHQLYNDKFVIQL